MKRFLLLLLTVAPTLGWAGLSQSISVSPLDDHRMNLTAYSETKTLEWGCPVADRISADNQQEAIQQIKTECLQEAQCAAASKPEVVDVIQTKVIWPDVRVLELSDGYQLTGTFFLETTVVQRVSARLR